jgi:hypothetical protein
MEMMAAYQEGELAAGGGINDGVDDPQYTSRCEEESNQGHSQGSAPSFNPSHDLNRMKRSTTVTDVTEE